MITARSDHRRRVEATIAAAGHDRHPVEPVLAYVNHGRWVADCVCGGAELVAADHPFLCGSCGGEGPVVFPAGDVLAQVEELLAVRPTLNRNWRPHETFNDLLAENIDAGLVEVV